MFFFCAINNLSPILILYVIEWLCFCGVEIKRIRADEKERIGQVE